MAGVQPGLRCDHRQAQPEHDVLGLFLLAWPRPNPTTSRVSNRSLHAVTIRKHVAPTLKKHYPHGNGIFQEDNAAPHRAKVAAAAREAAGIVLLPWPAQSPDLNPIENLWTEMKAMVRRRSPPPSNLIELEQHVKAAWKDLAPEYYRKLIESMPARMKAVITANGCITKY